MDRYIAYIKRSFTFNKTLKKLFGAVIANFSDSNNPLRVNNFAFSMRELLRNFLSLQAPDNKIIICDWYKNKLKKQKVTRRDRYIFLILGGIYKANLIEDISSEIESEISKIINITDSLSKFTHINLASFPLSTNEANIIYKKTLKQTAKIINLIKKTKKILKECLIPIIEIQLNDEFWSETFSEIDCLSTHSSVDSVWDISIKITNIGPKAINFSGSGTVGIELQYGSNSDLEVDNGVLDSIDLPFLFSGECKVSSFEPRIDFIEVDNSPFYGKEADKQ